MRFIIPANEGNWWYPQLWCPASGSAACRRLAITQRAGTNPTLAVKQELGFEGPEELSREITRLLGCESDPLAVNVISYSALPAPRKLLPGSAQINQLCRLSHGLKAPPGTQLYGYCRQKDGNARNLGSAAGSAPPGCLRRPLPAHPHPAALAHRGRLASAHPRHGPSLPSQSL